jgi:uncharacterized protein (DUF1697 family)
MKTYTALFRGINVGKTRSLPMKELTQMLEVLGCINVKTYIQSGNVVFQYQGEEKSLADRISSEVKKKRGFEPQILLLTADDIQKAMKANPFPEAESEPSTLHLGFLASVPANPDLKKIESLKTESERFMLKGSVFYLHAPDGIGRSKLAASSEKLLGVPMTDRNWRTVCKINDMVNELK